jgi:hypothetical protein
MFEKIIFLHTQIFFEKIVFENFNIFINNTICVEAAKVLWQVCLNIHSLSISIHKVEATSSIKPV